MLDVSFIRGFFMALAILGSILFITGTSLPSAKKRKDKKNVKVLVSILDEVIIKENVCDLDSYQLELLEYDILTKQQDDFIQYSSSMFKHTISSWEIYQYTGSSSYGLRELQQIFEKKQGMSRPEEKNTSTVEQVLKALQDVANEHGVTDFSSFSMKLTSKYHITPHKTGNGTEIVYTLNNAAQETISCWDIMFMRGTQYFCYDLDDLEECFKTAKYTCDKYFKSKYGDCYQKKEDKNKTKVYSDDTEDTSEIFEVVDYDSIDFELLECNEEKCVTVTHE